MLSLPDFKEKQVLYIQSSEIKDISFKNENLVIKKDGKIVQQVPFFKIFSVFVVGNCTLTSVFIKKLVSYGITLILTDLNFKTYSVIGSETEGNFLLREKQYLSTVNRNFLQAQWVIKNKTQNQLKLLKNLRNKSASLKMAIKKISALILAIDEAETGDSLRGIEGNIAKLFFVEYFKGFNWKGRKPRTKFDEINVLLDMGYTYLFYFIDSHLRLYGFDTYKGFFHTEFYQRKSLVCDLVEPFRAIIDKAIRKSYNLQIIDLDDFEIKNQKYKLKRGMGKKYAKVFLEAIMEEKSEIFLFLQSYYRKTMKQETDFLTYTI